MKLTIDLDEEWTYEETISAAIKTAIEEEIGKEIRKLVKEAVTENRAAIVAVASAYAKRMVTEAQTALGVK
jgi:rRNA-processing protein FCF1